MDGIINVYKEAGFTSHDVVAKLRGILHQKKIGHTGTLDPEATGVLPVCCGKATKVCELLTDKDKSYRAVCRLGIETDTQDLTGNILNKYDTGDLTEENIRKCVSEFQGDIMQIPPMYSALKVNGKKLYELAREGKTIERKARPVHIDSIDIIDIDLDNNTFTMDVTCSKGTYIRTLCHDIGKKLGIAAAMESLIRTRVSIFELENAMTLSQIQQLADEGMDRLEEKITKVDSLFPDYPKLYVNERGAKYLSNGNSLKKKDFLYSDKIMVKDNQSVLIYDEKSCFKAIYILKDREYKVKKMF